MKKVSSKTEQTTWVLQDSYLGGHVREVACVATKGDIVASASDDHTVRIWDKNTSKEIATLYRHDSRVSSVAVIDGNRVASGYWDKTIKIWNITTGECLQTLKGHNYMVTSIAIIDANRVVSSSDDKTIKLWNINTGECLQTLRGHNGRVSSVAVIDKNRIISGSGDKTIKIWNINTGECLQTLKNRDSKVTSVNVIDNNRVVSGLGDGTIKIWDANTAKHLQTLSGHDNWVSCVAAIDKNRVVSASADKTIRIWSINTGACLRTLDGHNGIVTSVAVIDGDKVASGSHDQTIKIWDINTGECLQTLKGRNEWITSAAIIDENRVISGSDDETIKIWDINTRECLQTLTGHDSRVTSVAIINNNRVISGSHDQTIKIWDINTGECLQTLRGHSDWVTSVAVIDKNMVISGSGDQTIRIWDINTGKCLQILRGHDNWVTSVAVIDKNTVISGSDDETIKIWNISNPKNTEVLYAIPRANTMIAYDSDVLFIVDSDGKVSSFDMSESPTIAKLDFELDFDRQIQSIGVKNGLIVFANTYGDLVVQKIAFDKKAKDINSPIVQSFYIKTLLLGDSGVGKTTLGYFLERQAYNPNIPSTHGMRFFEFEAGEKIPYGKEQKSGKFIFTVWDFGGQPEYQIAHKQNFDGARIILLVVDLESKEDEGNSIGFWINTIRQHLQKTKQEQLGVFIVGTKDGDKKILDNIKERIGREIPEIQNRIYTTSCNTKKTKDNKTTAKELLSYLQEHIENHFAISDDKLLFSDSLMALEQIKKTQKDTFYTTSAKLKQEGYSESALNGALEFLIDMGSIERLKEYLILKPYWKNILATSILRKAQNNEEVRGAISKPELYKYDFNVMFDKLLDDETEGISDEELYKTFLNEGEQELKKLYIKEIISNFLVDKICYIKNGMFVFPSRFHYKHKEYEMDGYRKVGSITLVSKKNVEVTIATVVCCIFYSGSYSILKHLDDGVKVRDAYKNEFFLEFEREDVFTHTKNQDSVSIIVHSKTSDEMAEKELVGFITSILNSSLEPLYSVKKYEIKKRDSIIGNATFVVKNSAILSEVLASDSNDFEYIKTGDTALLLDNREIVSIDETIKKEQERVKKEIEQAYEEQNNAKDKFVVLHLSDLHFTKDTHIENEIAMLKHDAANIRSFGNNSLEVIDYVVLSGDLSASGGTEEFETVVRFVEKLIEECRIDAQKVIIVPGNHDYSRDITHSAYKVQKFEAIKFKVEADYKINDDIYLQRQDEKWKKKFKNFSNKLYEAIYNKSFPSDISKQIFVMGNKDISFVMLNTSTQIDHFYQRRVSFDVNGFIAAQKKTTKNGIKIAVGHHPVNIEEHYDFINNLQNFEFTAYMHGHVHRNNMISFNEYVFGNHKVVNIGSGLFWSRDPKKSMIPGVPHRYNIIEFAKEKSITIETREREKTTMHWRSSCLYANEEGQPVGYKKI